MIIPFLLHHANRAINKIRVGREEFYKIKDVLLKRGEHINYDIQHFSGQKCWTCDGTGIYTGYYWSGEKWKDSCNRCWRGWYILPMWVCLSSIKFGRYYFHKPLKRERCVRNPFTQEELGWQVSERPVIEGTIEHKANDFGYISVLILFYLYDRGTYKRFKSEIIDQLRWRYIWRWRRIKDKLHYRNLFPKSGIRIYHLDEDNQVMNYNEDLPF